MISVRPAKHTDFEPVAALMKDFMVQHHHWQPEQFRHRVLGLTAAIFQTWLSEADELHLVAQMDGNVIGYAMANRWRGTGAAFVYPRRGVFVGTIVIAPDQRRNGAGRALFVAVERWATDFNAEYIGLSVAAQNDAAKSFYTALGYDVESEYRAKTLRHVTRMSSVPE